MASRDLVFTTALLIGGAAACASAPPGAPAVAAMSPKAEAWVDAEERACTAPRCRFGRARAAAATERAGCRAAETQALDALAKAIKVRVQSVFEETVAEMDGTPFSEVRSKIVVSTDVELTGAKAACYFEDQTAYAFAKMDFGPMIDDLRARLVSAVARISEALRSAESGPLDAAFVGYARALVEAVNADDARTWLAGLDPASATPYTDIPRFAVTAVDGLYARAKRLRLVPLRGNYAWAEPDVRIELRLEGASPSAEASLQPVVVWTGPLVKELARRASYTAAAMPGGSVRLPLKRTGTVPGGAARAEAGLDWPATFQTVRARVTAPRSGQILEWLVGGLPRVVTDVTVYTPGHPSPLVDGLRELFCDGENTPLSRVLELRNDRGRALAASFRREFEDRVADAMADVDCRKVALDAPGAPPLEVRVRAPDVGRDEAELRFIDRMRSRRVRARTAEVNDVCALRCAFKQWGAAETTCGRLDPPRGSAGVCLVRARYYRGEHTLGLSLAEALYRTDPNDPTYQGWYGILNVARGNARAGLTILERLAEEPFADQTPSYWLSLAAARVQTNDRAGACRALARFITLPDAPRREEASVTMARLECPR